MNTPVINVKLTVWYKVTDSITMSIKFSAQKAISAAKVDQEKDFN
jgi:hypothetical protein